MNPSCTCRNQKLGRLLEISDKILTEGNFYSGSHWSHQSLIVPLIYLYKRHVHCSQLGKNTCVAGMVHEQYAEGYEIVHGITHYMVFHTNSGAQPHHTIPHTTHHTLHGPPHQFCCPASLPTCQSTNTFPLLLLLNIFSFFLYFMLPFLLEACMYCPLFCF